MAVKPYSRARDGNKQLTPHFKVSEFACKDGSDAILIDDALVTSLQAIRDHFGVPVKITSAYRTASYNASDAVKGAKDSQHVKGTAADIHISGVNPRDVARWIETELNPGGLGLYDYSAGDKDGFVHIDTRAGCSRWVQTRSKAPTGYKVVRSIIADYLGGASGTRSTLRRGDKGEAVKELQSLLIKNGFDLPKYGADGDFGTETETAVKKLQSYRDLTINGTCDAKTWAALGV